MKNFILPLVLVLLSGCDDNGPDRTCRTVRTAGYNGCNITEEFEWTARTNGCGQGDTYGALVSTTNVTGTRVTVLVCCGYYKSCTVRIP
jgi:hypothetical protein